MYYASEAHQAAAVSASTSDSASETAGAETISPSSELTSQDVLKSAPLAPGSLSVRSRSRETELEKPGAERQTAVEQPQRSALPASVEQPVPEQSPVAWRSAETRVTLSAGHSDPAADRSAPSLSKFAGHWYYVPAGRQLPTNGMYLPEYIELHLSDSDGVLKGHYHARYRVTDRAIEPNVAFEFEGPGTGPSAEFSWNGPGAATGKVTVRLLSADRLEVTWIASRLSAELNLASGNAQLIRQREQ